MSSAREVTPSLLNTLRRWKSTVRGLTNSCAATSRLDRPCRTRAATWRSCAVRSVAVETSRRRAVSPEARSSCAARSAHGVGAEVLEHAPARRAGARGRRPGGGRGAGTRRRPARCGPGRASRGDVGVRGQRALEVRLGVGRRRRAALGRARRPRRAGGQPGALGERLDLVEPGAERRRGARPGRRRRTGRARPSGARRTR